jgi:geranylgeranyl transferase type-2 subunit alpha
MASLTPNEKDREYAIVTDFSAEDRIAYLTREIEEIKELAEDYDDVKWIYEALMEYTIALGELTQLDDGEKKDLRTWLGKLRVLDPMRRGRWDDVEGSWKL